MNVDCEKSAPSDLERLIERAQSGEDLATEALLEQFRPLLRARMHWLWTKLREELSGAEWADVEAQVQEIFLVRLQKFRPEIGVFFPYYIARLLDLDARDWLRRQRRGHAVPFSQLYQAHEQSDELDWWVNGQKTPIESQTLDCAPGVDDVVSLRDALALLSPPQREVIALCYGSNLTETAAATQLGISRSAVRNRLHGAIERLRAFFGQDGALMTTQSTRTGRRSQFVALLESEIISWSFHMAKDEKRPDLVGVGAGRPILLQGVYEFPATGLKTPQLLSPRLRYVVPPGYVAGIRFMRVGVTCDAMVCVSTVVNGMPHRLVPVAPNSAQHVPFAIVEPIVAGSEIEIHIASDKSGTAIIDVGCLEMPA